MEKLLGGKFRQVQTGWRAVGDGHKWLAADRHPKMWGAWGRTPAPLQVKVWVLLELRLP